MLWENPKEALDDKKKKMDSYRSCIHIATDYIDQRIRETDMPVFMPEVGIILGSGLGPLAKDPDLEKLVELPYESIPHFPLTTVEGHEGTLILGYIRETSVAVLNGRAHFYEYADELPGDAMKYITLPTRGDCIVSS